MTDEKAVEILDNERPHCGEKAVYSDGERCEAYDKAISALRSKQGQTPCSRCEYGGEHLYVPPCTSCPAEPKGQENNAPLTMDELQEMSGEPVWCAELKCYGIIKVETIGRWANIPFLLGAWRAPNCGSAVNFEYDIASRELTLYRHKPEEGTP